CPCNCVPFGPDASAHWWMGRAEGRTESHWSTFGKRWSYPPCLHGLVTGMTPLNVIPVTRARAHARNGPYVGRCHPRHQEVVLSHPIHGIRIDSHRFLW